VDSDKPLYCRTHTRNGNTQSSSNQSRCPISSPSFGIGYLLPKAYFRSASPPLPPTVVPVMQPIVRDRPLSGRSNMNDLCLPRMEGVNERHSSLENRRIRIGRSDVKLGLPVSKPAPASGARNELPTLCSMKGHGGEAAIGGSSRRPATSSYPLWTMRYFVIGGAPLEQSSVAWEPERVKSVESQKFTSISSGL